MPARNSSNLWIWLVVGGVVFVGLVVVAAVVVVLAVRAGLERSDESQHRETAPTTGTTAADGSVNIVGMPVTVADGTITTACFTFELPTVPEYEVNPASIACQVALRWAGGDSLSEIDVMAQSGDGSVQHFFDVMDALMAKNWPDFPYSTEVVTVDSRSTGLAHAVNGYGVATDYYQIPVAEGAFDSKGTPVTSILVSGPVSGSDSEWVAALDVVIASFSVRD